MGAKVTEAGKNSLSATAKGIHKQSSYLIDGLYFQDRSVGRLLVKSSNSEINNLGMNFFSRFDDYLFIPSKMLFCYNADVFTHDEEKSLRSIGLRYFGGYVELFQNDPAEISIFGLKNGDRLLAVNGQIVEPAKIGDLREILSTTPAGQLKLQIERDSKVVEVSF